MGGHLGLAGDLGSISGKLRDGKDEKNKKDSK